MCFYCENPNYAFAGSKPVDVSTLCPEHTRTHRMYDRLFGEYLPRYQSISRQPRWRYFAHKGWRYCWTTERMDDGKFAAFIYKPDGDDLILVKEVRYAKRMTAKAKALAWHTKAKQTASGRLPASALR